MDEQKLKRHLKMIVEWRLREYHSICARIASYRREREDIIHERGPYSPPGRGRRPDPTQNKAIRLYELDCKLERVETWVREVESAMGELTDEELEIVKLRYLARNSYSIDALAHKLHLSPSALRRRIETIVLHFARHMRMV